MFKRLFTPVLATLVFLLPAHAQTRGTIVGVRARGRTFTAGFNSAGGIRGQFPGQSGPRRFYPPLLWGAPYYDSDYTSQPGVTEASPQIVVVEAPSPATAQAPRTAPEPLLIEWQDGHYVRIGGTPGEKDETQPDHAEVAAAKPGEIAKRANHAPPPVPELQPAVLVYRDGHREEVREYTIADGILYASGDYWTDGYWNKKIQLAALNLPATENASQERGVTFTLPDSPNVVITRP